MLKAYITYHEVSDRNKFLTGCLLVLICGQLSGIVVEFTETFHWRNFTPSSTTTSTIASTDVTIVRNITRIVTVLTAAVDTLLAITLVILLRRRKNEFAWTNTLINRIMAYVVGTGAITAALAIAAVITSITNPSNFVFMSILEVLPKGQFPLVNYAYQEAYM